MVRRVIQIMWVVGPNYAIDMGAGTNTAIVPVYHAETSISTSLGRTVLGKLFVNNGIQWVSRTQVILSHFRVAYLFFIKDPDSLPNCFPGTHVLYTSISSGSPRWLASYERFGEVFKVLSHIMEEDPSPPSFISQMQGIRDLVLLEGSAHKSKITELWMGRGRNLYRLLLACSVQLIAQIGGINIFAYYVVIIFQNRLGLNPTLAPALAAYALVGLLVSNLTAITVIEKWVSATPTNFGLFWPMFLLRYISHCPLRGRDCNMCRNCGFRHGPSVLHCFCFCLAINSLPTCSPFNFVAQRATEFVSIKLDWTEAATRDYVGLWQ